MAVEEIQKSEKEIKSQVKETADRELDVLDVQGKDPKFAYRWLNTHKQNLAMKKARGWEVVSDSKIKTFSGTSDSTHHIGDMILARMPKERYEKMMRAKKEIGEARRRAQKEEFREEGRRSRVPTFDENR